MKINLFVVGESCIQYKNMDSVRKRLVQGIYVAAYSCNDPIGKHFEELTPKYKRKPVDWEIYIKCGRSNEKIIVIQATINSDKYKHKDLEGLPITVRQVLRSHPRRICLLSII